VTLGTALQRCCHDHDSVKERRYYVYTMASRTHVFYVGMTNNIVRRVRQHKERAHEGFTARYNIDRLVWYEVWHYVRTAIARERQIKPWRREKKIRLIESLNPTWQDLSEEWGKPIQPLRRTADPSAPAEAVGRDDSLEKG
jgi:putative endonuclease